MINLMNKLPGKVTRFLGKAWLKMKNVSPEVCIAGGIVCGGAAVVMVGVQTWRKKGTLEKDIERLKKAKEARKDSAEVVNGDALRAPETASEAPVSGDEELVENGGKKGCKGAVWACRIDLTKDILKTYWIPIVLGGSGIFLIWGGRTKLRRELSTMTLLYTTAVQNYNKLYNKIKEKYGEEAAQELAYGTRIADSVDAETGEIGKAALIDKNGNISIYAQIFDRGEFDEGTGEWIWKNPVYEDRSKISNYLTVKGAEDEATREVITRGWYLLGEAKRKLGLKPAPADWRVGWWYKPGQDNRVCFKVFEGPHQLPFNRGFADPDDKQNICIIDPNVDGCIDFVFDNIEKYDFRCGRRSKKVKKIPSMEDMFGAEYARKLEGWHD